MGQYLLPDQPLGRPVSPGVCVCVSQFRNGLQVRDYSEAVLLYTFHVLVLILLITGDLPRDLPLPENGLQPFVHPYERHFLFVKIDQMPNIYQHLTKAVGVDAEDHGM